MRLLLALLLGLLATPALAQLHPTARTVIAQAIDDAIRPAFADFATATDALKSDVGWLCSSPSETTFRAARAQFRQVVLAWSRVELYRFGPLMMENRSDRILFWPDRKGIALKQVQAILAKEDETAISPDTLQAKSVAVQGLGALEYVLFGTGAEDMTSAAGAFRCKYTGAIASLMADTAAQMSAEWQDPAGIAARMIKPSDSDPTYRTTDEVLEELIGVMAHGVEAIRDQRILPFLGRDGEAPKPKSALFWRSNMTVPAILGDFAGLEALLVRSDIWEYTPTEQFDIGQGAIAAFKAISEAGAKATGTVEEAVSDPAQKQALDDIVTASQTLGKLTGEDLPAALGLSVGFSSLDGD